MKKMIVSTKHLMILAVMMVMTISANAMSYNAAKHEALFLSDKMAYELNLTAAQYEAVYEINLDYLMSLNGHGDVFGIWWDRRNADLRFVLNSWQFDKYMSLAHFFAFRKYTFSLPNRLQGTCVEESIPLLLSDGTQKERRQGADMEEDSAIR